MTVEEFIEVLSQFPKDAEVIYRCYSEYEVMDADEPQLVTADEKKIILRNGRYMRCPSRWCKPDDPPQWATVVTLPGN